MRQSVLQLRVLAGGALEISAFGRTYLVDSSFSQPGATRGIWNTFGTSPSGLGNWNISVQTTGLNSFRVIGSGQFYRIERLYKGDGDRVLVTDTISLTADSTVGISIKHRLSLGGHDIQSVRLGGLDVNEGRGLCGATNQGNPTLFVGADSGGIGLMPLDDVLRVQEVLYNHATSGAASCRPTNPPSVELDDPSFGLDAHRTYSMRWSVYVVPPGQSDPYYWFINRVRQDIGANFTVDGSAIFFYRAPIWPNRAGYAGDWRNWSPAELSQYLKNIGVKYVILTIPQKQNGTWVHGSAIFHEMSDDSQQFISETIKKIHAARPDVKVLQYLDPFASSESGAAEKYRSARIIGKTGVPAVWPSKVPVPYFCPTMTNSFGRDLFKYADFVLDTYHADGIYIDESWCSVARYNYAGEWDSFSVETDPATLQVRRQIAAIPLLSLQARVALVQHIRERGGMVIANLPPLTETFARQKVVTFTETGALSHAYLVQLHSPVAMSKGGGQERDMDPRVTIGADVAANVAAHVHFGALTYYYHLPYPANAVPNPMSEMFPFTPIEIWPGYLIGAERIITVKSGSFGWNTQEPLELFVYARDGRMKARNSIPAGTGPTFASVDLSPGEMAIIVRQGQ